MATPAENQEIADVFRTKIQQSDMPIDWNPQSAIDEALKKQREAEHREKNWERGE